MLFKLSKGTGNTANVESIYPLLPLRDIVVFPYSVVPLFVGREKSIDALEYALKNEKSLFLTTQKDAKINDPSEDDIYRVGTLSTILQLLKLPDGTVKVLIEGKKRAMIRRIIPNTHFLEVSVEEINDFQKITNVIEALMRNLKNSFEIFVKLNKKISQDMLMLSSVLSIDDPSRLVDTIVVHVNIKLEDKQDILETFNPAERLEKLFQLIESEIEILQIEKKIKTRVRKQMEKSQKEYYLNEQMRAIQKEMGEKDEFKTELKELEENIKKKKMSKEATAKVEKEFKKLKMMAPMSAEATVVRNYIDWLISLPWYDGTEDKLDITEAEKILDADHYGLKQVKERIVEYLAVQSLVKKMKGPILCLVGPPGVGKTSLAKSVARATGRKFVRCSLGGVRDEAEIRGHRRTYIGSMPGKIIQSIKKAGSNNPVFLLDEVDKMSTDFRGDPSAALMEVLDPEQNQAFNDHYIDVDYDLSEVMFITTANTLFSIPLPLQDRMEIIRIAGYTELEKLNIAKKFLILKQIEAHGLAEKNVVFSLHAILGVIRRYTREAGVRNLEREIASICRKVAKEVVKKGKNTKISIQSSSLQKYLGIPKYRYGKVEEDDTVGLATGLAWTEVGGELLDIEVTVMPGKGKLTVTGKLGDVMQESAHAALSYVRSRAELFGLERNFYQNIDIHIHVPEGAIPKDGPSAGITIATSITSALIKKPVRKDIAMTGEITLRGRVLPIGGFKEKVLAAHRGGMKTIIIPKENEKDIKEVPAKILKTVDIVMVEHMDEVLKRALILDDPDNFMKKKEDEGLTEKFYEQEGIQEVTNRSVN
ncbi:MAG: endopeptidase La [Deltaproteobacteria bacterium CG_4_9_14_3_um_filter_44_9]|nr:MAG: endopeptidase La [Deltaproteobacteria bacterium CG_4_9_14_3_um_filter_44_9]